MAVWRRSVSLLLVAVGLGSALLGGCEWLGAAELPPVELPPAVTARQRALDDYDDRLLGALARVIAGPDLPSTERVLVTASPKVELMFIVAGLASGWDLYSSGSDGPGPLRKAAEAHFRQFRGHPAVRALARLRSRCGFWYDALPKLALSYSDPPALEQVYPLDEYLVGRAGGSERSLREFMARLKDFAQVSGFEEWWREHEDEYAELESSCRWPIVDADPLGKLEAYFGERLGTLLIIPSGTINCGFGGTLADPQGSWSISCFGPEAAASNPENVVGLTYHEGGHSFVNHHAVDHPELVSKYASLFDPIATQMRQQAYGKWATALNEHILRACQARIYLATKGEWAAEQCLARDESRGFAYVRALYERLAEYEVDRARYPDFASFYPTLITGLDRFR